jgi:hypothetical protein
MFGTTGLDPAFCEKKPFRQTVIYVDQMMMKEGETAWASQIAGKLQATLTPGERVTVVSLSPAAGSSSEIWSGCWPGFTAEEQKELSSKSFIFSKNPLDELKNQRAFFSDALGGALTKVYEDGRGHPGDVDASHPRKKNILAALSSDGARFSQASNTVRVIIYSDLAETNEDWSIFDRSTPSGSSLATKFGTHFRRSIFYVFGVGADVKNAHDFITSARRIWGDTLSSMEGAVGGIGSDLNVANAVPVAAYNYKVDLTRDGAHLFGRMSALVDADGNLVDSWIGIQRLTFAGLAGTLNCSANSEPKCSLSATTSGGLTTDSPSETVELTGSEKETLEGTVGVRGALTYPLRVSDGNGP